MKKWMWIMGAVLVCCAVAAAVLLLPTEAEKQIAQTLDALALADAVQVTDEGLLQLYGGAVPQLKVYEDGQSGVRCVFDGETGSLLSFSKTAGLRAAPPEETLEYSVLRERMVARAQTLLGGEYEVKNAKTYGYMYRVALQRKPDDGTTAAVVAYLDGTVIFCARSVEGTLVEDGKAMVKAHWISESKALEIAKAEVAKSEYRGRYEGKAVEFCGLDSFRGEQCYKIQFGDPDTEGVHNSKMWVHVDLYNGEVLGCTVCK